MNEYVCVGLHMTLESHLPGNNQQKRFWHRFNHHRVCRHGVVYGWILSGTMALSNKGEVLVEQKQVQVKTQEESEHHSTFNVRKLLLFV